MSLVNPFVVVSAAAFISITGADAQQSDGTAANPYRVMLIPPDGGTKADFQPVFNEVTQAAGIHFDTKEVQTYCHGGTILVVIFLAVFVLDQVSARVRARLIG